MKLTKVTDYIYNIYLKTFKPSHIRMGTKSHISYPATLNHIEGEILIGDRTVIFAGAHILGPVEIGERSFINRAAYIRAYTTIGKDVSVGPFVRFITDTHEISSVRKRAGKRIFKPIIVGDGVWIGGSATILGGVTLGKGSIIAAGALVKDDVPPDCIVAGVPARVVRQLPPLQDSPTR